MRRLTAVLLVGLMAGFSSRAPLLHIHEFAEGDHHHGPAAHEHHHETPSHADVRPTLEVTPPAETAVAISFVAPVLACFQFIPNMDGALVVLEPPAVSVLPQEVTDVRAHGPPLAASVPPRAPPFPA